MRKSPRTQGSGTGADSLDSSANSAADALQALATVADQLKSTLQAMAQAPGGAGANPGAFFSTAGQLAVVQSAQQTVQAGGSVSPSVLSALTSSASGGAGGLGAATGGMPGGGGSVGANPGLPSAGGMAAMSPIVTANAAGGGNGQGYVYAGYGPSGPTTGYAYPLASAGLPALQRGAGVLGDTLSYGAQQELHGGSMVMEQGRLVAGMASAAAGAIGTMIGGPATGAVVAGISNSILGPLSDYINAPIANRLAAQASLMPLGGALYGSGAQKWATGEAGFQQVQHPNGFGPPTTVFQPGRLDHIVQSLGKQWAGTDLNGTISDVAAAYGGIASSLFEGGVDPMQGSGHMYDRSVSSPYESYRPQFAPGQRGVGGKLIPTTVGVAGNAIINYNMRSVAGGEETLSEAYTRRLGELVGTKAAPEVAKQIAPIFATLPETGGNVADILTRYGAQNTATALRLNNDQLESSVDPLLLMKVSANMRSDDRATQFASLQARGSGAAESAALSKKLADIAELPDGKDSLVYAQTKAARRNADRSAFDQEDATAFGIPMTHLQGQLDRANIMPFAPANVLKLSLQTAKLDQQEIGRLDAYVKKRRDSGDLSEQEELELARRRESLLTDEARIETQMSEGWKERLPAMMANVPGRVQGRFTTPMMAANNMAMMGVNNIWAYGAANGKHLADQNAMFDDIGGPPERAQSRTATSSMTGGDQARIASLLEQILAALKQNNGRGGRASDAMGQLGAAINRNEFGGGNSGNYN